MEKGALVGLGRRGEAATLEKMSGVPPERLFRDEGGAAIERVARLEDENRKLRDEVERLARGEEPRRPTATAMLPALVAILSATLLVGGLATAIGARCNHRHVRSQRISHVTPEPRQSPVATIATGDCVDDSWTDADGVDRFKFRCTPGSASQPDMANAPFKAPRDECSTPSWLDAAGTQHYKRQCVYVH